MPFYMQKDTAAPYFGILNNSIRLPLDQLIFCHVLLHISIDLKDPHDKKGMICKDPEVNSNFQEVFYSLKIRVYFP